jgi:hypothetical protein
VGVVRLPVEPESFGSYDEAHLHYKRLKAGMVTLEELSARELGLVYAWFPEILPDVEQEVRP